MDEIRESKSEIRIKIAKRLDEYPENELARKNQDVMERLFEFANFLEAKIALLYIDAYNRINMKNIIEKCYDYSKIIVLPQPRTNKFETTLLKVDNLTTNLTTDAEGNLVPDHERCKSVPIDRIDIAIIPGLAFDEKGGRVGAGDGYYDRLIPKLPTSTRKVALAFEDQILQYVPMESHDKHVDIIITEKRTIYKI